MKKIEYDVNCPVGEWRKFDGNTYVIQKGKVFLLKDGDYFYTKEISEDQLEMYGEPLVDKPDVFEMKVLNIREKADGSALITAEDGNGLELVFKDDIFSKRREKYEIGKTGNFYLFAKVFNAELTENFKEGVCLTGKDAEDWFYWKGDLGLLDEVQTDLPEAAMYSESENFSETGRYDFEAAVMCPGFASLDEKPVYDEYGELDSDMFKLYLPGQFDKIDPKSVNADFDTGKFPHRIYQDLPEDENYDFSEGGWAIKGSVEFSVFTGEDERWWSEYFEDADVIEKYGQNISVPYYCKMEEED